MEPETQHLDNNLVLHWILCKLHCDWLIKKLTGQWLGRIRLGGKTRLRALGRSAESQELPERHEEKTGGAR